MRWVFIQNAVKEDKEADEQGNLRVGDEVRGLGV